MVGFGTSRVEPSYSNTRKLLNQLELRKIGYEKGRGINMAQSRVQWHTFVLAVLHFWFLLPPNQTNSDTIS